MTRTFASPDELVGAVGVDLGTTRWIELDEDRVRSFAVATSSAHSDPSATGEVPAWLVLAATAPMLKELYDVRGVRLRINYGTGAIRWLSAVPVGSAVRARAKIDSAESTTAGVRLTIGVEIESKSSTVGTAHLIAVVVGDR